VLDLGCGTGRLLLAYARRGYWTLGVDLSAAMLAVAAEKKEGAKARSPGVQRIISADRASEVAASG